LNTTTQELYTCSWMPVNDLPLAKRLQADLRARRLAEGLSQAELAGRLGVTQQMMAKLESPSYEPSLTQFERLSAALQFELTYRLRRTTRD
jgi:transcriptional regulator with XRE-family HTH domain